MSDNLKDIDGRINNLWSKGCYSEACYIIAQELLPAIVDYLVSGRGLIREDAEDAVGDAHHGFLKKISEKGPLGITAPKPYIWRAATTRAIDCKKRNEAIWHRQTDLSSFDGETGKRGEIKGG